MVLTVHRRNGGELNVLDLSLRLLDPVLILDSLDLAEIVVGIEKEFHYSPFDGSSAPRTWADLINKVEEKARLSSGDVQCT